MITQEDNWTERSFNCYTLKCNPNLNPGLLCLVVLCSILFLSSGFDFSTQLNMPSSSSLLRIWPIKQLKAASLFLVFLVLMSFSLPCQAQRNERESIRQKLALGSFYDDEPVIHTSCSKNGPSSRWVWDVLWVGCRFDLRSFWRPMTAFSLWGAKFRSTWQTSIFFFFFFFFLLWLDQIRDETLQIWEADYQIRRAICSLLYMIKNPQMDRWNGIMRN